MWNGQKAGSLSLRVKRDERVGFWLLDGVDMSVMAWCQTLCHSQCLPHQLIPQWLVTVQCVSKPLLLPLQSVCWCCCVVPLLPFVQSHPHWQLSSHCCLHHELCLCWVRWFVCCVMSSDGVWMMQCVSHCPLPKKGSTAHGPDCM